MAADIEPLPKPSSRSFWRVAARALGYIVLFALTWTASALLHLNTDVGRKALTHLINRALQPVFEGSLVVESLDQLSFDGLRLSRVLVVDPNAERVLQLRDVRVQLAPLDLLDTYLSAPPNEASTYIFPHLRAEEADVLLLDDAQTGVTLARALTPKPTPEAPKRREGTPNPTRLWFPSIEIGRIQGSFDLPVLERLLPRLVGVRGSLMVSPNGVAVDVERFGLVVAGLPGGIHGTGTVKVRVPGAIEVQFSGYLNDSEVQASFELADETMDVTLVAPRISPETIRAFVPAWPLLAPTALQAHANGTLPYLNIDLVASIDRSPTVQVPLLEQTASFSTQAQLDLSNGIDLTLVSQLAHLSLNQIDGSWPASDVNALVSSQISYHDDKLTHHSDGYVPAMLLYGQQLPEWSFAATTESARTVVEIDIDEPGAPGKINIQYLATGEIDATVSIPKLTLKNQRRLPSKLTGQASIDGKVQVRGSQLTVDADIEASNLTFDALGMERLNVQAHTQQSLENPTASPVQFTIVGRNLATAGVKWQSVTAQGDATLERVKAKMALQHPETGAIRADATYDFATGIVRDANLQVDRSGLRATMIVPLLDVEALRVEVASLVILRPGCPPIQDCPHVDASGAYDGQRFHANIDAQSVHLERLWPLFGQHFPIYGKVDLVLALDSTPGAQSTLDLHGEDVSFLGYGHGNVDAQAMLESSHLTGNLKATNSLGVQLEADTSFAVNGDPLDVETWQQLTGFASVRGGVDQLETIAPLFQQPWLESLSGQAEFLATLNRTNPKAKPAFAAELRVNSLDVAAKFASTSEPLALKGHGLYVNATFDADTSVLYGSALLQDANGPLLRVKNATIPLPLLTAEDSQLRPALLVNTRLESRDAQQLPYLDRTSLQGSLGADLTLYGTLEEPELKLLVVGSKLSMPGLDPTLPVDLSGSVHYRDVTKAVAVDLAAATDRKTVLLATLDGTYEPSKPYTGTARVFLDDLPLALVSAVSDMDLTGQVTGLFELSPDPSPHARLSLQFDDLASGRALVGDGKLQGDLAPGRFAAQFSVTNTEHSVLLSVDALSPPEHLPTPNTVNHVRALVRTRQMNAATLSPLLKGLVARLGGNLDSDVSLEWERPTNIPDAPWSNRVSGVAHLRNGRAYVDGLGLELQDITADAVATPLGERTHLALDRIQAKARSREVNFQGRGQLMFDGASVVSGSANVVLQDVPLTLQGLNLGKASGAASAELKRMDAWPTPPHQGKSYMQVNATLADFNLRAARTASRSLINTNPSAEIEVVQNKPVLREDAVLPYRIYVDLGKDARFSLADLDIPLSGVTQIDYTNESVLSGTIVLKAGGRIPLLGRLFEVQEGNLRLNPDAPSNPNIDISLTGRSKDGDPLDVTLTGTLEEPIVTPTLARLQELLGGGAASALSGGFQALGLASMLGDSVQLRVGSDAADESLARYSAAVEVRENLWFEVNYQRNDSAAFQTKNEGAISGTLDYRLNDNWSLRTEAGTAGGSVDVVWQFRY